MRALVTGGAGFVGTNLIKRLSNNNHVEYREHNSFGRQLLYRFSRE